jgi:hypothetical protein
MTWFLKVVAWTGTPFIATECHGEGNLCRSKNAPPPFFNAECTLEFRVFSGKHFSDFFDEADLYFSLC